MGHKITRQEESARHAYRRALTKATHEAAKGSGWKCSGGMLFRDVAGWFFDAYPMVAIYWRETRIALHVKPMGVDPIFWDVVDMRENRDRSLSFRGRGAWVCRAPPIEEGAIDECGMDAEAAAREFVRWTVDAADRAWRPLSLRGFFELLENVERPGPFNPFLATKIVTQILMGDEEEARRLAREAKERGDVGGFTAQGTFPEMALRWLDSRRSTRVIH